MKLVFIIGFKQYEGWVIFENNRVSCFKTAIAFTVTQVGYFLSEFCA